MSVTSNKYIKHFIHWYLNDGHSTTCLPSSVILVLDLQNTLRVQTQRGEVVSLHWFIYCFRLPCYLRKTEKIRYDKKKHVKNESKIMCT